jgi:hypothetical protein
MPETDIKPRKNWKITYLFLMGYNKFAVAGGYS